MAYDEELADRIRDQLVYDTAVIEKRMFGGLAFMVEGHMTVVASRDGGLMARVDPEEADALLAEPHVGAFEMRGKPLAGWLRVDAEGVATPEQLEPWVRRSVDYARSLPPKG
jgi:TfoX/Sxy family transcriptional regulator of competence genes